MKILWTRRALADLTRIAERIAQDKPLDAERFIAAIKEKVTNLERFPLLGRVGPLQDARELVVHKNYLVMYRVRADAVHILQVWHVARSH